MTTKPTNAARPTRTSTGLITTGSLLALAGFFLLLPTPRPEARQAPGAMVFFDNVRVFDGEQFHDSMDVLVREGTIVDVASTLEIPSGTSAENLNMVNGDGRTLLPGLFDGHVHSWGNALERSVVFGVTTVLDHFSDASWAAIRRTEQAGDIALARADLFSAGTLATAPGGHGTQYGLPIPTLEGPEDAAPFVRDRLAEGSDWIKLVIETAGGRIPTLDHATAFAVIDATHASGARALAHAPHADDALALAERGIDGFVHGITDRVLTDEEIGRFAESGVFFVSTVTLWDPIDQRQALFEHPGLRPFLRPAEIGSIETRAPWTRKGAEQVARGNLARMIAAGIPVIAGTDAPNPGTSHGVSIHREIELLSLIGLSAAQALASATSLPARLFDLADRGRIAPGLRADLLLVEGNPSADLLATRDIRGVWVRGRRIEREPVEEAATVASLDGDGRISDFEDGLTSRVGSGWSPTSDQRMGGASTVELEILQHETNHALSVRGEVRAGHVWPWAGTMWFPGAQPMRPVDLTARPILSFRIRGDGSPIGLLVFSPGATIPSRYDLPTTGGWASHQVDLAEVAGSAEAVQGVAFVAGPDPRSFSFALDDLRLLPFDREDTP